MRCSAPLSQSALSQHLAGPDGMVATRPTGEAYLPHRQSPLHDMIDALYRIYCVAD